MSKMLYLSIFTLCFSSTWAENNPDNIDNKNLKPMPIRPPLMAKEDATEVKVIVEKNRTIEEYRQRGELILVKVIPNKGKPYYIDPLENRRQGSAKELMNAGVKPVHWVVKEF